MRWAGADSRRVCQVTRRRDEPPPPATFERGDDASEGERERDRDRRGRERGRWGGGGGGGGRVRERGGGTRRGWRANVVEPAVPDGNDRRWRCSRICSCLWRCGSWRCPTTICCTPRCSWRFCSRSCGPGPFGVGQHRQGHRVRIGAHVPLGARLHPGSHGDQPPGVGTPRCDCWAVAAGSHPSHDSHGVHPRHQLHRVEPAQGGRGCSSPSRTRAEAEARTGGIEPRERRPRGRDGGGHRGGCGRSSPRRRRRFGSPPSRSPTAAARTAFSSSVCASWR